MEIALQNAAQRPSPLRPPDRTLAYAFTKSTLVVVDVCALHTCVK